MDIRPSKQCPVEYGQNFIVTKIKLEGTFELIWIRDDGIINHHLSRVWFER